MSWKYEEPVIYRERIPGLAFWPITFCTALCLMIACSATAPAQSQSEPQVHGQEITLDELNGVTVNATIAWSGTVRWSGNNLVYPAHNKWRLKVVFGPGGTASYHLTRELRGAGGKVATHTFSGTGMAGRPNLKGDRDGAGASVWSYENNTLTSLKVFEQGGRVVVIKFARTASGLSCTLRGNYVGEIGAGNVKTKNQFGPGYIQQLSMKQTSSTCQASTVTPGRLP